MIPLPITTLTHLRSRIGRSAHLLLWIEARNRASGAVETLGLWTGDDHRTFVIDGETRVYFGAGGVVQTDPIVTRPGLDVQMQGVTLYPAAPEVEQAIRGYDVRLAPVEIHRALFHSLTGAMIDTPQRRFEGWIDNVEMTSSPDPEGNVCRVSLASSSRAGTKGLTLKKSDESQKARLLTNGDPDRFYQYADVSGAVPIVWGEK